MDWRSIAFDWNRARAFLVTAEEGSLSAAARALNMTQPTLGRQVTALEEELGVALFERGGRGLEPTPTGLALLEHVRTMGNAASRLSLAASGQSMAIDGTVRISATEATAAFALPPVLTRLRQAEPGIHVEIVASNDQSDLKRREADIAVRAIRPEQPDLIARKLGDVAAYLYAAPSYLDRIGNPETPEGFRDADFVFFENVDRYMDALAMLGLKIERNNFRVSTENFLVQWEFVKSGAGIGVMPDAVGDAEPAVRRALPSLEPFETELWLVAHRELRTSRRLRLVFDYLARELAV